MAACWEPQPIDEGGHLVGTRRVSTATLPLFPYSFARTALSLPSLSLGRLDLRFRGLKCGPRALCGRLLAELRSFEGQKMDARQLYRPFRGT